MDDVETFVHWEHSTTSSDYSWFRGSQFAFVTTNSICADCYDQVWSTAISVSDLPEGGWNLGIGRGFQRKIFGLSRYASFSNIQIRYWSLSKNKDKILMSMWHMMFKLWACPPHSVRDTTKNGVWKHTISNFQKPAFQNPFFLDKPKTEAYKSTLWLS
jgi:hypothetical protein